MSKAKTQRQNQRGGKGVTGIAGLCSCRECAGTWWPNDQASAVVRRTYRGHIEHALTLDKLLGDEEIQEVMKVADADPFIAHVTGGVHKKCVNGNALIAAWSVVTRIAWERFPATRA